MTDLMALAVSPVQWITFMVVAAAIMAPRFIPPVARWMGRGVRLITRSQSERPAIGAATPARPTAPETHDSVAGHCSPWAVWLVVALSAAVLSWLLLRSR
ncbi:MAG: twin-arginine translocase TatA/TatE family subunit [Armatimonadetes bacterium]|nr:twin-arginine translocase TatA/TatE family subunit [Armatimonadota bacterium]